MKRKLVVRLKGGLGNQLFCYATARRLALKNDAELVLDHVSGFRYDYLYQRRFGLTGFNISARLAKPIELFEPLPRLERYLTRKWSQIQPWGRQRYIEQIGVEFDERLISLKLQSGTTWFDGFGQSERYFEDVQDVIRNDLRLTLPITAENQLTREKMRSEPSACLHLRWFDSNKPDSPLNMPLAYYEKAIKHLVGLVPSVHFYIFSDNTLHARQRLSPLLQKLPHTYVDHNQLTDPMQDFWLMTQCDHFIISNSTYAWWSAWLGEQVNGMTRIIAPANYLDPSHAVTAWGFPYLLPNRWIIL